MISPANSIVTLYQRLVSALLVMLIRMLSLILYTYFVLCVIVVATHCAMYNCRAVKFLYKIYTGLRVSNLCGID